MPEEALGAHQDCGERNPQVKLRISYSASPAIDGLGLISVTFPALLHTIDRSCVRRFGFRLQKLQWPPSGGPTVCSC